MSKYYSGWKYPIVSAPFHLLWLRSSSTSSTYSWPLNNTGLNYTGPLTCGLFSLNRYHSATWSAVGWICGCVTADTEGRLNHMQIFICEEGWPPNPCTVRGSTVLEFVNMLPKTQTRMEPNISDVISWVHCTTFAWLDTVTAMNAVCISSLLLL